MLYTGLDLHKSFSYITTTVRVELAGNRPAQSGMATPHNPTHSIGITTEAVAYHGGRPGCWTDVLGLVAMMGRIKMPQVQGKWSAYSHACGLVVRWGADNGTFLGIDEPSA